MTNNGNKNSGKTKPKLKGDIDSVMSRGDIPFEVLKAPIEEILKFYLGYSLSKIYFDEETQRMVFSQVQETEIQRKIADYFAKNFFEGGLSNQPEVLDLFYISMLELHFGGYLHENFINRNLNDLSEEIKYLEAYLIFLHRICLFEGEFNYHYYQDELQLCFLDLTHILKRTHENIKNMNEIIGVYIDIFNLSCEKKICVYSGEAVYEAYNFSVLANFDNKEYNLPFLEDFYNNLQKMLKLYISTFHSPKGYNNKGTLYNQLNNFIGLSGLPDKKTMEGFLKDLQEKSHSLGMKDTEKDISEFLKKREDYKKTLKENIIGQDEVIDTVFSSVVRNYLGINKRPASFLFVGESGVGKTQLAIELANVLGVNPMIANMGNLENSSGMSFLLGAPPGYIGMNEPVITEEYFDYVQQESETQKRVILPILVFDEIEKASPVIFNMWLELLDRGTITLNKGRVLDFSNAIVILTSNIGTKQGERIGFSVDEKEEDKKERNRENYLDEVKKNILPEILNRLDDILVFNSLEEKDYQKIKNKIILKTIENLEKNNSFFTKALGENAEKKELLYSKIKESLEEGVDITNIRLIEKKVEELILDFLLNNI